MFELGVTTKKRKRVGDIFGDSGGIIRLFTLLYCIVLSLLHNLVYDDFANF